MILKDDVTAAIRRAFQLGQTYWQQADSESYKENKKADATRDRYNALCIETAEIAARADTRIAELETAMKRQAAAVRMLDMSHVARAETMMQHAQVLRERLRNTAQIIIECIGATGPENAEDAAKRAVRFIAHQSTVAGELEAERDQLRAQLAEYEAESATLTVGSKWPKGL